MTEVCDAEVAASQGGGRGEAWLLGSETYWTGRERPFCLIMRHRIVGRRERLETQDSKDFGGVGVPVRGGVLVRSGWRLRRGRRTRWLAAPEIIARFRSIIMFERRRRRSIRTWIASTRWAK